MKNRLISPFHEGNGLNGNYFDLFMTEFVYINDIIYNQKTDMYVKYITHIDDGDFMEEYYIVRVQLMHNDQDAFFEMRDLSDTEVFRLYATQPNK